MVPGKQYTGRSYCSAENCLLLPLKPLMSQVAWVLMRVNLIKVAVTTLNGTGKDVRVAVFLKVKMLKAKAAVQILSAWKIWLSKLKAA